MGSWASLYFFKVPSSPAGTKRVTCLGTYLPDFTHPFDPLFWVLAKSGLLPPHPRDSRKPASSGNTSSPTTPLLNPIHLVRAQPRMRSQGLGSCKALHGSQFIVRSTFPSFGWRPCLPQVWMTNDGHHLRAFHPRCVLPCLETGRSWGISFSVWAF